MPLNSSTDVRVAGAAGNAEAPEPEALAHPEELTGPWWKHLTGYHWFVFIVASAAWFFDCLDQRIFSLARIPALTTLKDPSSTSSPQEFGKIVTACFLIGWGIGGLAFGSLGDRFGRARMLTVCILTYSVFTGLSFFSSTWFDFTLFRFLTGVGVGGVFGLAVALIAETVPPIARAPALGLLQVLSTIGNITAGFVQLGAETLQTNGVIHDFWRYMFLVGAAPALMVLITGRWLREPESWLAIKATGELSRGGIFASYGKLFREKRWRKNLLIGALIASTGVIGLWAISEYATDLQRMVFANYYDRTLPAAVLPSRADFSGDPQFAAATKKILDVRTAAIAAHVKDAIFYAYICNMVGAGIGMWLFTKLAEKSGRRVAFLVGFLSAMLITAGVYWKMDTPMDAYWMMGLMGVAQLSVFAGFAIYLPELFPGSLRSTGTSFCYNLGRFAAAGGSFFSAYLSATLASSLATTDKTLPLRYSAIIMCSLFLIGILTLPFAPETKGKPLPTE